jgi:4-amino-4-deoxy-L-arabinose transferase-like glycosyltransferase
MTRSGIATVVCWFVLLAASMVAWLGSYPLMQPDEGRNAEVAREMVATGNFAVPYLNGLPYVDKPVLYFAAAAASLRAFGANEFAARLPSILFTLATAAMVAWFGWRVWGTRVGLAAAFMSLSAPLAFGMSRVVILDSLFTMLVVGAVISFYLAIESRVAIRAVTEPGLASHPWRRWSFLAWGCIGLGILTKGPVALLVPLAACVPYGAYRRATISVLYPPAIAVAAGIVAPWVATMSRALPDYLHYVLFTEIWQRVASDQLHRTQPFWFFIPVILAGTFPWICLAIAGLWRRRGTLTRVGRDPRIVFLLLWIALPFLFFSLSRSKLPHYMLPLVPAVALLAAVLTVEPGENPSGRSSGAALLVVLGLVAMVAPLFVRTGARVDPATLLTLRPFLLVFGASALLVGAAVLAAKPRGMAMVMTLSLPMIVVGFASGPVLKAVGSGQSARRLAHTIRQQVPGQPLVVGVGAFPTSLPFYLGAPIEVSSGTGNELTSNYVRAEYQALAAKPGTTLHPDDWWRTVLERCEAPTVFVIRVGEVGVAKRMTEGGLPRIARDGKFEVFGPCRPAATEASKGHPIGSSVSGEPPGASRVAAAKPADEA